MSTQPLTPEETNVLIAESLVWKRVNLFYTHCYPLGPHHAKRVGAYAPNFHGSLDACHDMEKSLTESERLFYGEALHAIIKLGYELDDDTQLSGWSVFETAHATAPQRCLAYIKTKGLIK